MYYIHHKRKIMYLETNLAGRGRTLLSLEAMKDLLVGDAGSHFLLAPGMVSDYVLGNP